MFAAYLLNMQTAYTAETQDHRSISFLHEPSIPQSGTSNAFAAAMLNAATAVLTPFTRPRWPLSKLSIMSAELAAVPNP